MENLKHVKGRKKGKVVLYALSTCVWCKKTRNLLDEIGVEYHYVYVDLLDREENEKVRAEVVKWNPQGSFPTIVIDEKNCITGFDEPKIRKELG
jgi:glutaredoxin-like protein NrdH